MSDRTVPFTVVRWVLGLCWSSTLSPKHAHFPEVSGGPAAGATVY